MSDEILVVAEHTRGELHDVTLEVIGAAIELKQAGAGSVVVALLAADTGPLIQAVSREGVDEVVHVQVPDQEFNSDAYRLAVEQLVAARQPVVALMGHTTKGMAVGPGIAARLGLGFASDVVACSFEEGALCAIRDFYGGKVQGELELDGRKPAFLLLRAATWEAVRTVGDPVVTTFAAAVDPSRLRVRHVDFVDPPSGDADIANAAVILAIGRGIGERENVDRMEALAGKMGVELAASRPLVDAGWVAKPRQVGQSGVTVKPKLYLALGISGAVQHLAGMKASEQIVAVNQDASAPIFGIAHLGAVTDLFDVVDELEKLW